jgi:predicted GTPase
MHRQLLDNLPFSHVITLADGLNLHRWLEHLGDAKTALRLGRMIMNPIGGVLNEAKSYAQDKAVDLTLPHLQSWLLNMYIQKVGEYAILLYSGRMSVASEKVESLSVQSRQDRQQAKVDQESLDLEPLRILVAGQTNAGKSSLINALFDKPRAATDVVSCTVELMPYQLEREGQLSGLIFDTPGYGEQISWLGSNRQELDKTDLVLLVCSANNAARAADRRFLHAFEQHFQAQPHRKIPPIVLVVTHIDELRPIREWQPPYNIEAPNCIKAENIRNAIEAIQQDLALPSNTAIVPVSLGTNEGLGIYNVDSLILAMGQQRDEAYCARLLRCLKDAQGREKWPQLWRQFASSGLWLLRKAGDSLP